MRAEIEAETDALDAAPWDHLGAERTARLVELGKALTRRSSANGAFSAPGCVRRAAVTYE